MPYEFYMPTRAIVGKDCIINNSGVFKAFGKKALIVTGKNSAKKNGSEKDVKAALDSAGIGCAVFDRVVSNPAIPLAYEGAAFARENGADFIVAIGGGSPMDAGKAIALLAAQDIREEELFSGKYGSRALPILVVPTTAGSGSEATPYAVLVDEKAGTKLSIASRLLFPAAAFLDPKYTEMLPVRTTVNTAVDALSHAVESMLSVKASAVTNALASESLRLIMDCIPEMLQALSSPEAAFDAKKRAQLLQASFMAGMAIAQTGTTAVHAMGYSLTCFRDIDHGRANGLLLGEYLGMVERERPDLAGRILGAMGLSGVNRFKRLMDRLLGEKEDIGAEEIERYSRLAFQTKNIDNSIVRPEEEDIRVMYELSFSRQPVIL